MLSISQDHGGVPWILLRLCGLLESMEVCDFSEVFPYDEEQRKNDNTRPCPLFYFCVALPKRAVSINRVCESIDSTSVDLKIKTMVKSRPTGSYGDRCFCGSTCSSEQCRPSLALRKLFSCCLEDLFVVHNKQSVLIFEAIYHVESSIPDPDNSLIGKPHKTSDSRSIDRRASRIFIVVTGR